MVEWRVTGATAEFVREGWAFQCRLSQISADFRLLYVLAFRPGNSNRIIADVEVQIRNGTPEQAEIVAGGVLRSLKAHEEKAAQAAEAAKSGLSLAKASGGELSHAEEKRGLLSVIFG